MGRAANYNRVSQRQSSGKGFCEKTYATSLASAHVVGKAVLVVGVAHEDGGLDGGEGSAGQGGAGAAAEGVVHDLTSLGVADHDDLGVGAALVQAVDGRDDGRGALLR